MLIQNGPRFSAGVIAGMLGVCLTAAPAYAFVSDLEALQLANGAVHQWRFEGGDDSTRLADSGPGGLSLTPVVGEGNVDGVFGMLSDISYVSGADGAASQAYRPFHVDATVAANAGAGKIADGLAVSSMMTVEAIVMADPKLGPSGQNYIIGGRPGPSGSNADRLYFLTQRTGPGERDPGRILANTGNNFGAAANQGDIVAPYQAGDWYYVAATFVLDPDRNVGITVNGYYANLTDGGPLVHALVDQVQPVAADNGSPIGLSGPFGIGNFPVVRTPPLLDDMGNPVLDDMGNPVLQRNLFGQEFFQGAIDSLTVYGGLLAEATLESHLTALRIPEPASLALLGLGSLALASLRRRAAA